MTLVYLLECLQKTAPPVLIFAEKQTDVDDVLSSRYLLQRYKVSFPLRRATEP